MTALSQSGYPVITDRADPRILKNPTVPGADVQILGGMLAGPVATVLLYYASRFNNEVEHLALGPEPGDDWGGNARPIRGGTDWSDHASYTAMDLNATEHPQHKRGTFTAKQYAAMRRIAHEVDAAAGRTILRLGIDWTGDSVDEMHASIGVGLAGTGYVERAAHIIAQGRVRNVPAQLLEGAEVVTPEDIQKIATATRDLIFDGTTVDVVDAAQGTTAAANKRTYTIRQWAARVIRLTGLTQDDVRKKNQTAARAAVRAAKK